MNVDGGCIENLGACAGAVFRDEDGKVQLPISWKMEKCWSPLIAESKAMLLCIQAAVEFGFTRVAVESDCLNLINAISAQERGNSSFHLILDDIIHVSSFLDFVSWNFIRRDSNKVAHELAHHLTWGNW
ncbi:uncharacterized protein LOC141665243 [Apium graveolens]|uniref:uncharacterized protein LOC141665243 n=1 Tax=Apium graveolens TaxID=4045 RepID=UPI003D7AC6C7